MSGPMAVAAGATGAVVSIAGVTAGTTGAAAGTTGAAAVGAIAAAAAGTTDNPFLSRMALVFIGVMRLNLVLAAFNLFHCFRNNFGNQKIIN